MGEIDAWAGSELYAQIDIALNRTAPYLSFPAGLEARFETDRGADRNRQLRLGVLVSLILYNLFLVCDLCLVPGHFLRCLIVRLAIVTPLIWGVSRWLWLNPAKVVRESIALAISCVAAFTTLYLWHGVSTVASAFSQTALVLLVLYVNTFLRLRFRYALAWTLFSILDGIVFLSPDHQLSAAEKLASLSLLVSAAIFTLAANYWMEREERNNYLLGLQFEMRSEELSAAGRELTRLSNLDALSGLANRQYFLLRFAQAWEAAIRLHEPVSVLLIDIDYFKRINERYGRPYGDQMLIHIGQILQRAVQSDWMVARYSGEEFAILLPGMGMDTALRTGERLRKLVRNINVPIDMEAKQSRITISVGVAAAQPEAGDPSEALLGDAELALCEAQTRGRDRVWPSPAEAAESSTPGLRQV